MIYIKITAGERYPVDALVGKQCTVREIGAALGCDKGTLRRELRRNRGGKRYLRQQAQSLPEVRRQETHNARELTPETWAAAETMLRQEHSLRTGVGTSASAHRRKTKSRDSLSAPLR